MKFVTFVLLGASSLLFGQSNGAPSDVLAHVAEFHGNAGVFAVAGYRMGERALHD